VLPCLNEAASLAKCIHEARRALEDAGVAGEVIVADNGSSDGSQAIAAACGARVCTIADKGYGSALMGGIAVARGRYVLMADADGTYDLSYVPRFIEKLRQGCDLVMGNRFVGSIEPKAMPFLHRYLGNPVLSGIGRFFFSSPVRDFHCGIRAFRADAYAQMGLRCNGMEFASEMVVKASVLGMRIGEVPAALRRGPPGRSPHLRTWRDGWRHLRFLLLYSPRWLFLVPGAVLMAAGLGTMCALLPGPFHLGTAVLDVHTMVYAACAVLLGFQTIAFAAFSHIFAVTQGLLPASRRLEELFRYITLETGLACGAVLAGCGLIGSVYAATKWGRVGFGPLDYELTMRTVIPSATALTLGIQVMFASFFLSLLGIRRN